MTSKDDVKRSITSGIMTAATMKAYFQEQIKEQKVLPLEFYKPKQEKTDFETAEEIFGS